MRVVRGRLQEGELPGLRRGPEGENPEELQPLAREGGAELAGREGRICGESRGRGCLVCAHCAGVRALTPSSPPPRLHPRLRQPVPLASNR